GYGLRTRADAEAIGAQLAAELCADATDVLACLREQPFQSLADWHQTAGVFGPNWGPSVEGAGGVLPDTPEHLIAEPDFQARGAILGTNKNEWDLFALTSFRFVTSQAMLQSAIDAQFGSDASRVEQQYTADSDSAANAVYTRLMSDILFRCPTRRLARMTSDKGGLIYLYSFEQGAAIHGQELDLVFGDASSAATVAAPLLSLAMQDYWVHFAQTSTPNSAPLPIWPRYQTSSDQHMTLNEPPSIGAALSQSDCDFWDDFLAEGGAISLGL
ncbi:MAG TPA: carboxylesterase family protein, partial [Polyangiales bacterium]